MAHFYDLPPEVLREIFLIVLLNNQASMIGAVLHPYFYSSKLEESRAHDTYSRKKLLSGSFIDGLDVVYTCKAGEGGEPMHYHHGLYQYFCAGHITRGDILALNSTSKRLRTITQGLLWRMVELGQGDQQGVMDGSCSGISFFLSQKNLRVA